MKKIIIYLLIYLTQLSLHAQNIKKTFYARSDVNNSLSVEFPPSFSITQDSSKAYFYTIAEQDAEGYTNGIERSYYMNGTLKEEGMYIKSKALGIFVGYYEDGKKKFEVNYEMGKKHGNAVYFYENGEKREVGEYYKGVRTKTWKFYYANGKTQKEAKYTYKNSGDISVISADSTIIGYWDSTGTQTIKNGEGDYISYYKNGQVKDKGTYKKHKKTGVWLGFYEDGKSYYEEIYEKGLLKSGFAYLPNQEKVVYDELEKGALPKRGMESFYRDYLAKELRYPNEARRLGIEGKIYIQFIVEKDGTLSNIEIVRGIGGGCDDEAWRVIKQASAWNAGQIRGQAVRQRMVMPIIFKLD